MASKKKQWVANAQSKSQVWVFNPPVTQSLRTWALTINGKPLTVVNGVPSGAVSDMQKLWAASTAPEHKEIKASVVTSTTANPQGGGTNEIQAIYISGTPTGGSFQVVWASQATPFLIDPSSSGFSVADSGNAGNPDGAYKYTYTLLNRNPLGDVGETLPSGEKSVTVTTNAVTVTVPVGPIGTIGRRIYRTSAGGATGSEKLVATIWDNSTTSFTDDVADGSLGAVQPTENTTGIPYDATAVQMQTVLQSLQAVSPGNIVVTGSGTTASPWLVQFANDLGSAQQALIGAGSSSFNYTATVPATSAPGIVVTEIQQGLEANAQPTVGMLMLVSKTGVPFYVTSTVSGEVPAKLTVTEIPPIQPPAPSKLTIASVAPSLAVARTASGHPGTNEIQKIAISPNGESGSTFTLTFGGHTTNGIPLPPGAPTVVTNGAGNISTSAATDYYYCVTFLTANGETEPSAPSAAISLHSNQTTVTIETGPSGTTKRRIYRTLASGSAAGPFYLVATVADNTTTSYSDNNSDTTISANPPPPSTNGVLQGELEGLASVGLGNVQVSGANFSAYSGMAIQQGFPATPPVLATGSVSAPTVTAAVATSAGGSLSTGTYYYNIVAVDDVGGVSLPSTELSAFASGSTSRITLTWTAASGATGYRIYRGTTSGGEATLVGTADSSATSFVDYGTSPAPIAYSVEFINDLANASQSLMTGSSSSVSVLPMLSISETQEGYAPQNELQVAGWTQQYGVSAPGDGSKFTLYFPDLDVTTDALAYGATASDVLAAIRSAAGSAHHDDFAVTQLSSTSAGNKFVIEYKGNYARKKMKLVRVGIGAMVPADGDTVYPYATEAAPGSPSGRNEIATVTIQNDPTSGTFGLTGTLANGNTISASSVAYNASASTLQAAFPAATVNVSGSAGGPYTIEAVGEAGGQKVTWTASSSLGGGSSVAGSPPADNTTGISSPASLTLSVETGTRAGALPGGTYYYTVTATNSAGETTGSSEASITISTGVRVILSWSAVSGATGYNVYRGSSAGGENKKIASGVTGTSFTDCGNDPTSATPPGTNTAGISTPYPGTVGTSGSNGNLSTATYYYEVTAVNGSGETDAGGGEAAGTVTGPNAQVSIWWAPVTGAMGYNVYRSTTSGSETLIASLPYGSNGGGGNIYFTDSEVSVSSATPPASNGSGLSAPVQSDTTPSDSGGSLVADTYYYEITATNSKGETTASNEKSGTVTTGSSGSIALAWGAVTGASGYKIYRGLSSGGENILLTTITSGATTTYTDTGAALSSSFDITETFAGEAAVNEVQTISVSNAGGGYYHISLDGSDSGHIAWNASATDMQTALEGLPDVGTGNVSVSKATSGATVTYTVTFNNDLAARAIPILVASDIPVNTPPTSSGAGSPPLLSVVGAGYPSRLTPGVTYYYVITAVNPLGVESVASNEIGLTITGNGTSVASALLTWQNDFQSYQFKVYRGTSPGKENILLKTFTAISEAFPLMMSYSDFGLDAPQSSLAGGAKYNITLNSTTTDSFKLSFGGYTTSSIAYNAAASTVQADLVALTSIGSGNATVSGSNGGPWAVSLDPSIIGSDTLTGTVITAAAQPATRVLFAITINNATGGTWSLQYGSSAATFSYNATAAQIQTAVEAFDVVGSGNCTVTGSAGGPWAIDILANPQNSGLLMTVNGASLDGTVSVDSVYPLVYSYATGPNFWDAPSNWNDGAVPSAHLSLAPVIDSVTPVPTDSTLVDGTTGSLTSGQTYYYKVTATNANGETNGSAEGSAEAFAGSKLYFNGTASSGTFDLTYGGQTASSIAYNASAATIQSDLEGLSSIGSGNCTFTGSGTEADPFLFQLAGTLAGDAPTPLGVDYSSLTGATISVYNLDTRTLRVAWNEVENATGYKVYRGTTAGSENVLVTTIASPDQTVFFDDGTYTTSSASPNTSGSAYHTAVGDDIYFTNSSVSCWYNIGSDIANGYSIHGGYRGSDYMAVNSLTADSTFTGRIGLSARNSLGYQEYRPRALELNGPPSGVLSIAVGAGTGSGAPFINLDTGTSQILMAVNGMGTPGGTTPALLWVGSNSASEIDLFKGTMGIAIYPGDTAQLGTVRQAHQTNVKNDTSLQVGSGCSSITNFYKNGGDTLLSCDVATLTGKAGTVTQDAGGVTTALTLENCYYTSKSTTGLGAVKVSTGGTFDRSQDSRAVAMDSLTLYAGATYLDPHGETVTTGDAYLDYTLVECGYSDVTLDLGRNITGRRTQN